MPAPHRAHAPVTATAREEAGNLHQASDSNREIGTAMGILMATHKVTRADAFTLLHIASHNSNRTLLDIATTVVDTGTLELPTAPQKTPSPTPRLLHLTPPQLSRGRNEQGSDFPRGGEAGTRRS